LAKFIDVLQAEHLLLEHLRRAVARFDDAIAIVVKVIRTVSRAGVASVTCSCLLDTWRVPVKDQAQHNRRTG
jgi:hypothetical protein